MLLTSIAMLVFGKDALTGDEFKRLTGSHRHHPDEEVEYPRLGRFTLIEEIACRPPDECFHAWPPGRSGRASPLFLRTFPHQLLTAAMREWLKACAHIAAPGVESVFKLAVVDDRGIVASEYIFGASIADIRRALRASGQHLSWPVTLALFGATLERLLRLHERGAAHGGITARLVRLTATGEVWLCRGLPHALERAATRPPADPLSLSRDDRDRDLVALGHAALPLGAGAQSSQVSALFAGGDRHGFAVLSDLIVEDHPEITDLVVEALWPLGDPRRQLTADHARLLTERALGRVSAGDVRHLLQLVASSSPDHRRAHHQLGR